MLHEIGPQHKSDHSFIAKARLNQSRYRAEILKVPYGTKGNMLQKKDAEKLINYYPHLQCREALRKRYPNYSDPREANMLRSEHIPFNLFPPLEQNRELAKQVFSKLLPIEIDEILCVKVEHAPKPKSVYLDDNTSFDGYVELLSTDGFRVAIGIEVKYTELAYSLLRSEKVKVEDPHSTYWQITESSGCFTSENRKQLAEDALRQVWRNHLLGLSMIQRGEVDQFYSLTLYPVDNTHFSHVLPLYKEHLVKEAKDSVLGITFEQFIDAIESNAPEIVAWREYLRVRYIVE